MMLSVILLSMLLILLCYSKSDQKFDLWKQLNLISELESDLRDTADCGRKWLVVFMAGKKSTSLVLTSLITLVLLIWKWIGLLLRKNYLLR